MAKTPVRVTVAMAMPALRAVVADVGPDYRYVLNPSIGTTGCTYVQRGRPDCIVGRTLAALGVPVSVLKKMDSEADDSEFCSADVQTVLKTAGWSFTAGALRKLGLAQAVQDDFETWGSALAEAERARA